LGKERDLTIQPGDFLAVRSAGAYGFTMSSNYNTRPRAVELMVDGDTVHVVRERETLDDLLRGERVLP
jgi:diaminopimelate decarboxylase